jgi:hypothetical protein
MSIGEGAGQRCAERLTFRDCVRTAVFKTLVQRLKTAIEIDFIPDNIAAVKLSGRNS